MNTRRFIAWAASAALLPFAGAGSALAQGPVQAIGQDNTSSQTADSDATSTQVGALNRNISVRVLSPGDDGDVTQSNSSKADADASNSNETRQSAAQQAIGAAEQLIGQSNGNRQSADADATSKQIEPKNDNIVVRVLSPGKGGDVTQSNSSQAGSTATNGNTTSQTATQQAFGSGCGCGGPAPAPTTVTPMPDPHPAPPAHHEDSTVIQAIGQENHNNQSADSDAKSEQYKPANQNISVRVLSPGSDGDVTQSNSSKADSKSSNDNATTQTASQQAGGPVLAAPALTPTRDPGHCGCGGDVLQLIGQANANAQRADSEASSKQAGASNSNVPVAIGGVGGGGDVTQSNESKASSDAANHNTTGQSATQRAGGGGRDCGCHKGDLVIQAIGQDNGNRQSADSDAKSWQKDPSNENGSFDVGGYLAHGKPGGPIERMVRKLGEVKQSNSSGAESDAANSNSTGQSAEQSA